MIKNHEKSAYKMGLKPWEFWALTISEFISMFNAYQENLKTEIENKKNTTGLICATIMNAQRTKETQKVWTTQDFFETEKPKTQPKTDEELFNTVKMLNKAFGGTGGG